MRPIAIFLLFSVSAFGAAGDYYGAQIDTQGWELWLQFNTMNTNGTFAFGFGTNNSLTGSQAVTLNVISQGYDDSGSAITVSRKVYGTKQIRLAYPNQAFPDVSSNSPANITTVKVALSDYIFSGDSNITVNVAAGFYSTNSVNSAAVTAMPVTNNSTTDYPKVVANWTYPQSQKITGTTYNMRAMAFHAFGQQSRPVRMVKFILSDSHTHTNTVTVLNPTISTLGEPAPIQEYVGSVSTSGLTSGDKLFADFIAYPWVGNSALQASLTGFATLNAQPTMQNHLLDTSGTYLGSYAVVTTNGNDATGVAETAAQWAGNTSPNAFATIAGAATAIKGTNGAAYGHPDVGGGTIYLKWGSFLWTGGTGSYGTNPFTYVTVAAYPGLGTNEVIIGDSSGDKHIANLVHIQNVTLTNNTLIGFDGHDRLWLDGCVYKTTGDATLYHNYDTWLTGCTVSNTSANYGVKNFANDNTYHTMLRGNTIYDVHGGLAWVLIGNKFRLPSNADTHNWLCSGAGSIPSQEYAIAAFNDVVWPNTSGGASAWYLLSLTAHVTNGLAIVGNLVDCTGGTTPWCYVFEHDGSTGNSTNVLIWYNTSINGQIKGFYNDQGTVAVYRDNCQMVGNIADDFNIKSDTFTGTPNANRTGNWNCLYAVGWHDNAFVEITNVGAPGDFLLEGIGLNNYQPYATGSPPKSISFATGQPTNTTGFVDRVGKNYRLSSSSILQLLPSGSWMSYDLEANARGGFDPPGAYSSASPKKGAFFSQ